MLVDIDRLHALDQAVDESEDLIRTAGGRTRVWTFSTAPLGSDDRGRRLVVSMAAHISIAMSYFLSRLPLSPLGFITSLAAVAFLPHFAEAQTVQCENTLGSSMAVPTGFGASWNVFITQKELLVSAGCTGSSTFDVTVGSNASNQYVYKNGYYWTGTAWQLYGLAGTGLVSDVWYPGRATASVPSTGTVTHLLGYVCQQVTGVWKCGCRDTACATPSWQLQTVQMTSDTGKNGTRALGVFVNDPELGGGARDEVVMDNFATLVGGKPAAWLWYEAFGAKFIKSNFDAVSSRGYTPVLSWAPSRPDGSDISWETVAEGDVDNLIHDFARSAAAWGKPLYLRPEWEMNLKFNSGGNTPDSFVRMWKRLHDIFVQDGAANVRWFWCPNEDGASPQTPYASYYPGDAYVDYVGFDAYNWGTTQPQSQWRSPIDTYGPTYNAITKLSNKPLIIGETGSSELGGDKAAWITSAFLVDIPQKFPRIIGVLYFNNDQDGSNWRVNTSNGSLEAFKAVVASPIYQGRLP